MGLCGRGGGRSLEGLVKERRFQITIGYVETGGLTDIHEHIRDFSPRYLKLHNSPANRVLAHLASYRNFDETYRSTPDLRSTPSRHQGCNRRGHFQVSSTRWTRCA